VKSFKTHKRITVYKYQKSGRLAGITRSTKYEGCAVLEVDIKCRSVKFNGFKKYIKMDNVYATDYIIDTLEVVENGFVHFESELILTKADLDLRKWGSAQPLAKLPVRHFEELSKEELYWTGEREGNVGERVGFIIVILALYALSFFTGNTFLIVVALLFSISALLNKPFSGWKVAKKPVPSLLKELKEYKNQLRHTRYLSATFLDEKLKKFSNWKKLSPQQFEVNVAKLLNQKGYDVSVTQFSNDGGIDLKGVTQTGQDVIVQVKQYKSNVGVAVVREMIGIREGFETLPITMIYALNGYTRGAKELALQKEIILNSISDDLF